MTMLPDGMPAAPQALDPLRFPLRGSRLIEASAGTGKTFTIAALYLRLVLGPRDEADETAFLRPLNPPDILVVTFTDAATKELRDRIRARLAEAAGCFLADPATVVARPAGEDLLHDLRASYAPEVWPMCARKLQLAAEWMDEAAVSTIHGWCNRMLREHAFDSDSLFTQQLETDNSELLAEVVRDYWRSHMYPLTPGQARQVATWWASPAALEDELGRLLGHLDQLGAAPPPAEALAAAESEKAVRLAGLKAPWTTWLDELRGLIDDARTRKACKGTKLRKDYCDRWFGALEAWRDDPALVWPALSDSAWSRLSPEGMADAWNDPAQAPDHPALAAIAALPAALEALPDARQAVLIHGAGWVAARFAEEQARRAQMGFDDLLTRLDAALSGPNGARLAAVIRQQFPVALIDEFQDTDAIQYRIFDAIYRVADNDAETAVVLIGDPKQAIYAFRGADIYTYLAARRATAGRLYTLGRNFRSSQAMVDATNRCFALAEAREEGAGAFLFRSADDNPVPFLPAAAAGRKDVWQVDDRAAPALSVWHLPPPEGAETITKGAYLQTMADVCASEMVRLLQLGQQGRAGFARADGFAALRPADMAVLVNNRNEADAIRGALGARGVRSVYLSERESVFKRPEAAEMRRWLAACAEPDDGRCLRAALASGLLGLDWATLDQLNRDEAAWEARVLQFRGYRACWQRQGVLPMLRRLLNDFRVPARLLAAGGAGERSLTDLLHLAELLQQASTLLDGEHALIRHLAEQCDEDAGGEARQLRLESDADLVQVVTVHKSKGLEYPLVFLPFACAFRPTSPGDLPLKWHDAAGRLQLALADEDGQLVERADRERLGEDLRKLYVALTRACHATWIGTAPLDRIGRSALGYLLGGRLGEGLETLAAGNPAIRVIEAPEATAAVYLPTAGARIEGAARAPRRSVRENWWIASYSALHTVEGEGADTPAEDVFRESAADVPDGVAAVPSAVAPGRPPAAGTPHAFPRGAAVGTFLHELLEWAGAQGFARVAGSPELLRDAVARRCALRGWESWIEPLCAWIHTLLGLPLGAEADEGFSLAGLDNWVVEMEFWIAVHEADLSAMDALVRHHTLAGAVRPALQRGQLNGMLKGFIDLVAEHAGRYYVIDYKSNWLGPDDAAYSPAAMTEAVLGHRYELQYVLYLLALHRLLRLRLPDYDYDRHVGGAVYVFLRGAGAPSRGVHREKPPRALIEALDRLFSRAPAPETP